jgi:hypothetical protein
VMAERRPWFCALCVLAADRWRTVLRPDRRSYRFFVTKCFSKTRSPWWSYSPVQRTAGKRFW